MIFQVAANLTSAEAGGSAVLQYQHENATVCRKFAVDLPSDNPFRFVCCVLEGRYWQRREDTV